MTLINLFAEKMPTSLYCLLLVGITCLLLGCNRGPVDTYESGFMDSLRAEFDLGKGRVEHERISELLRARKIGFVDGTMWSGPAHGADYTDLRINVSIVKPEDLVDELMSQGMIGGDPTWFVNGVEIETADTGRTASPSPETSH